MKGIRYHLEPRNISNPVSGTLFLPPSMCLWQVFRPIPGARGSASAHQAQISEVRFGELEMVGDYQQVAAGVKMQGLLLDSQPIPTLKQLLYYKPKCVSSALCFCEDSFKASIYFAPEGDPGETYAIKVPSSQPVPELVYTTGF